jgi:hypothetical protein
MAYKQEEVVIEWVVDDLLVDFDHLKGLVHLGESDSSTFGFLKAFVAEVDEDPSGLEIGGVGDISRDRHGRGVGVVGCEVEEATAEPHGKNPIPEILRIPEIAIGCKPCEPEPLGFLDELGRPVIEETCPETESVLHDASDSELGSLLELDLEWDVLLLTC